MTTKARFILAVLASGVVTSFTDWLFMGLLFHRKYFKTPEIWRNPPGQSDTRGIIASSLAGTLSCAAFIFLCMWTGALTVRSELHLAQLVWIAGALPIILSNIVWIKMHPLLGVSHSLGWLARFVASGLIAGWLLGK
jgi:uncharacterized protein DUF1761